MNTKRALALTRYAGIGAALFIPALVVAQNNPFVAGQPLRASDLAALSERVRALETRMAPTPRLQPAPPAQRSSLAIPVGGNGSVTTGGCASGIPVSCSCNGSNFGIVVVGSVMETAGTCSCAFTNLSAPASATGTATLSCVTIAG